KRRGRQGQSRPRRCLLRGILGHCGDQDDRKAPHPNANLIVVTPFAGSEYQGGVRVCRWRAREWLRFRARPTVSTGHRHATATRARAGALFLERALLEEYLLPDPRRTLA